MAKNQRVITFNDLISKYRARVAREEGATPSLEMVAAHAGVGRATLYRMLAGSHASRDSIVERVARALGFAVSAVESAVGETRTAWLAARSSKTGRVISSSPRRSRR